MSLLVGGSVLQGKYVIERVVGQGGMGTVYLAHHSALGNKPIAIKEMHLYVRDPLEREKAVAQFHREAQLMAHLQHPCLVEVSDYFEEGDNQYLVMSFVDGRTLQDVMDEADGFLDTGAVLGWMDQICDVLVYLHSRTPPVIYRDLKPTNIMLEPSGRIRLLDFGIARVAEVDSKTSTLIKGAGTPGFAPVEQFGQGTTDARSDIYALGATLYTLVTKSLPPLSVDLIMNEVELIHPREVNPAVSGPVEEVILKMMALRKEHRYQSSQEARQALQDAVQGIRRLPSAAPPAPRSTSTLPSSHPPLRLKRVKVRPDEERPAPSLGPLDAPPAARAALGGAPPGPRLGPLDAPVAPPSQVPSPASFARPAGPDMPTLLPAAMPTAVPPPAPVAHEDAIPLWAQKMREPVVEAPVQEAPREDRLLKRFWRWYLYCGILVLSAAAVLPLFLAPNKMGPLSLPNALVYNIARAVGGHGGGIVVELALPLLLGLVFYWREEFFLALLMGLWLGEGLFEISVGLRATGSHGLHFTLPGDLQHVLGLGKTESAKLGRGLQLLSLFTICAALYGMSRWVYKYRPTKKLLDFYQGLQEGLSRTPAAAEAEEPAMQLAPTSATQLQETSAEVVRSPAEERGLRMLKQILRPFVNLALTWCCVEIFADIAWLKLSLPPVAGDPDVTRTVGVAIISLVMFGIGEGVELAFRLLQHLSDSILLMLFPLYVFGMGAAKLFMGEALLSGWFVHLDHYGALFVMCLFLGGTRWHLDRSKKTPLPEREAG